MVSTKTLEEILASTEGAGYTDEQLFTAYTLLDKIILNILNHPLEEKYRNLKTDNAMLKAKLFCIKQVNEILDLMGFQLNEGVYHFSGDLKLMSALSKYYEEIHEHAKKIERRHMSQEELQKELLLEGIHKEIEEEMRHKREEEDRLNERVKLDRRDSGDRIVLK